MTIKKYLSQALTLDRKINTKMEEYEKLRQLAYCLDSLNISEKVKTSHENNVNKNIDKLIDLDYEIIADINKLIDIKIEIKNTINTLNNEKYRQVLFNRYVNCLSFEKCAEVLNYSVQHIFRLHNQAIKSLKKL